MKLSRKTILKEWHHQALGRLELTLIVSISFCLLLYYYYYYM